MLLELINFDYDEVNFDYDEVQLRELELGLIFDDALIPTDISFSWCIYHDDHSFMMTINKKQWNGGCD